MDTSASRQEASARGTGLEGAFYAVLPYALLAACAVVTMLQPSGQPMVEVLAVLGLTLLAALWITAFALLGRRDARRHLARAAVYYVGLMALTTTLVALAPWYAIFAFIGYVHAYLFLEGRWRYLGVVATSMIMTVGYMGGFGEIAQKWALWAAISAVTVLLAATSFHFTDTADISGRRQRRAFDELHAANAKLESALRENGELQAQLLVQAREAGVRDERQRVARELHDTLAQNLAGILTQLQAAEQTQEDLEALRTHVRRALDLAREGLVEARRTVHALGPAALEKSRLPDAIDNVARRWSEVTLISAALTTTGTPRPMHPEVEVTLLRTAQEALANVAKHAHAARVGLTLSYMDDLVTLDVRDDGVGFDTVAALGKNISDTDEGGYGLAAMRQRVQRLAGRLVIESKPGAGTAILAAVPAIPLEVAR